MTQHLNSIVYYRALSIVLIVASHCLDLASLFPDSISRQLFSNFIVGATTLFVFISGYLFHHVFYPKFRFIDFMKGRLSRIAIPYLVIGIPSIFILNNLSQLGAAEISKIASDLATGAIFPVYWYIPFILLTFCFSPLHIRFISLASGVQVGIIGCLIIVSMLAHRPAVGFDPWHSVVYYAPVYFVGICISIHRERLLNIMRGREIYLLAAALGLVVIQTALRQSKNSHKAFFDYQGFDLMFLSKLVLAVALFFLLERLARKPGPLVHLIASTSFAIYFVHPILIMLLTKALVFPVFDNAWIDLAAATGLVTVTSVCLAVLTRQLVGRRSRFLLGY